MVSYLLLVHLVQVNGLSVVSLSLLLLNLLHNLVYFDLETLLELFLHLRILLDLGRSCRDDDLHFLPCFLALAETVLIFSNVLFEVVKHLQFLVEGDQRVKFVLQLNFSIFE